MPEASPLVWFKSLFRGNKHFFTVHQPPFSVDQNGKHKAAWCGFAEYGTKSFPFVPEGRTKGDFVPVTEEQYREHLNGTAGLALAPVFDNGEKQYVCFYGALDIDARGVDYVWFVKKLYSLGFKFAAFRSKSAGLHVYFFFQSPEPAAQVIDVLKRLVEILALNKLYQRSVEIFPKQASAVPGDQNANGLLLPFFGIGNPETCPNRMYAPDGKLLGIRNAMPLVDTLITTLGDVRQTIEKLPYRDAPYCIQALLLTGALFQEGDHRNDFLFTAALYLKLKEKTDFKDSLDAMNARLEGPLEDEAVDQIYDSVVRNDYQIWGQCKKHPCMDYCDRPLCKKRVFGVGKDKGSIVSDIEFGKTVRVLTRNPYYLIEVRVAGTEAYSEVRIDDTSELLNQRVLQRACILHLKHAPVNMKQEVWIERLNKEILSRIEDKEVTEQSDMTEESAMYKHFLRYIVHGQTKINAPYMVSMGHVYYEDGVSYFDGGGFKAYLAAVNFKFGNLNIRAELETFGCTAGELRYRTMSGNERTIQCWVKPDDAKIHDLRAFYEETYEADKNLAADIPVGKEAEEENHEEGEDDGTRF
jgi:hypothetical protein